MKRIAVVMTAGLLGGCAQAVAEDFDTRVSASIADLQFLSGSWTSVYKGGWSEEHWSAPRTEMMIGYGRSGEGGELASFEYLRIVTLDDGTVAYLAAPGGGNATQFTLSDATRSSAVFENADHDFPQRISYVREGDSMAVEISLIDGTQSIGWSLTLAD